jgi:hypothetical protein
VNESSLIRLEICAPLFYINSPEQTPFPRNIKGETLDDCSGERLFCFELDPEESLSIEPRRERFLGPLILSGSGPVQETDLRAESGIIQLAAGVYLFTQKREVLDREACIDMAIEQQKDGLWERYKLQNRLYIRRLFEDSSPVTQIFRPILA